MNIHKLVAELKDRETAIKYFESTFTDVAGYTTSYSPNFEAYGLYRARKHNILEGNIDNFAKKRLFISESSFWEVPCEVAPLGRCNFKGQSKFYCSNSFDTTMIEMKPALGDYISMASFAPYINPSVDRRDRGNVMALVGKKHLQHIEILKPLFNKGTFSVAFDKFDRFIDDAFHIDVYPGYEDQYLITAAIADIFCRPIHSRKGVQECHGIIYPSIAQQKQGFNMAFIPKYVKWRYYFRIVQTFKIISETNDRIVFKLMRQGRPLRIEKYPYHTNSYIIWENLEYLNKSDSIEKI